VTHQVIGLPVSKMAATLDELSRYGFEPGEVTLSMLCTFARFRRFNLIHKVNLGPISYILEVESKDLLATAPRNLRR
jgi:hypothetical protein